VEDKIDLHLHSYYSDGTLSPTELVQLARQHRLRAVSLTDHDCLDGLEEAMSAGEKTGVEVIPGVELSVEYEGVRDIHILGYLFDYKDDSLNERLEEFRKVRRERGRKIVDNINAILMKDGKTLMDYNQIADGVISALGRPHIARKLVDMGHAADMREAFERFLKPCNEPKAYFTPAQAIDMLHSAGGVAVMAHPGYTYDDRNRLGSAVSYLSSVGLDGIEAMYGDVGSGNEEFIGYLSSRYGLVKTGGSDFHGDRVGFDSRNGGMDVTIPYNVVDQLKRLAFR
jgi:hypothetical protein